jgi:hypothetical protein
MICCEGEERFCCEIYGQDFSINIFSNVAIDDLARSLRDKRPQIKNGRMTMLIPQTNVIRIHDIKDYNKTHLQACTNDVTFDITSEIDLQDIVAILREDKPVNYLDRDDRIIDDEKLESLVKQAARSVELIEQKHEEAQLGEKSVDKGRRSWDLRD